MLQQLAKITHKLIENDLERFFFHWYDQERSKMIQIDLKNPNWFQIIQNDQSKVKKRLKIAKGIKKY